MKIIILVGIPGAGKSTYAKQYINDNSYSAVRINRDDLRTTLTCLPSHIYNKHPKYFIEDIINNTTEYIIEEACEIDIDVIIDNTNCNLKHLKKFIDYIKEYNDTFAKSNIDIEFIIFDIDKEIAKKRVIVRDNTDDVSYIDKMYESYLKVKEYVKNNYKHQMKLL